jgi:DNA-binding protein H-NS
MLLMAKCGYQPLRRTKMKALESIQTKIQRLQAQAEAIVAKRASEGLARIHDLMQRNGLTAADIEAHLGGGKRRLTRTASHIGNGKSRLAAKGKLPPKYMNPKTGETWSGHARPPRWIAGVRDRSKFLIDASNASAGVSAKRKSKVAGTRKTVANANGKLPPKYRNPKTGATWSGHARPPAWIKDVKDRSRFLI